MGGRRRQPAAASSVLHSVRAQCAGLTTRLARRAYTTASFRRVPYRSMKREAPSSQPSNADLVHETALCAERPLTFKEIFARVNARRPLTPFNPRETVRGALSQGPQLVNLGDGRYGFLPRLIEGSLIRLPLTEKKPANHPLIYPDEVRHALFPSRLDIQKRQSERPARLRLPDGSEIELALEFLGPATWGS